MGKLTEKADRQLRATYAKLTPWQKTLVSRHPDRPKAQDYVAGLITEFTPLAGDRAFADDAAVIGGIGRFFGHSVVVVATEKGSDTDSRVAAQFRHGASRRLSQGAPADGAGRAVRPADPEFRRYRRRVSGIEAEARGQAEAIARSIEACLAAPVPFVATIIGEGGSGGAIALATADRVLMLEHAIYSVISPEGGASILWRDAAQAPAAAEALRLTADDLKRLELIDAVIPEPIGGAHRAPEQAVQTAGAAVQEALLPLLALDGPTLIARRREKFLGMGREIPA